MNCVVGCLSPCEWSVVAYQDRRCVHRIHPFECVGYHCSCLSFICRCNLLLRHFFRAWNVAVECVCVGRAYVRNRQGCLRPCCCVCGMCMDHTACLREIAVYGEVGRCVGRRTQVTLYDLAVKVDYDHILSLHVVV